MSNNIDLNQAVAEAQEVRKQAIEAAAVTLKEVFAPKLEELFEEQFLTETKNPADQEKDDYTDDGKDGTPAEGKKYSKKEESDEEEDTVEETLDSFELEVESIMKELEEEINEASKEDEEELDEASDEASDDDDDLEESLALDDVILEALNELLNEQEEGEEDEDEEEMEEKKKGKKESVGVGLSNLRAESKALKVENRKLRSDLKEAYDAITEMREELNEVALLNAKLTYLSKLNNEFNLNLENKSRIIDLMDKVSNVRELKLLFATLSQTLGESTSTQKNEGKLKFASDTVTVLNESKNNSTEQISEGVLRNKKLAGLI
jgi:hypothetical protein